MPMRGMSLLTVSPGVSRSTIKADSPLVPPRAGLVRAKMMKVSAKPELVVNTFWPLRI